MSQSPNLTKNRVPRESTDSSSSRESSPERVTSRKPRSFSPESESSDSVAPRITVHETSPSTVQPVIRKGLAFPGVTTRNISTYEASVKTSESAFLPGQEVQATAVGASTSTTSPVALDLPKSSVSPTPGPPASSSNPATPSPHLSAMSTPSDKSVTTKGAKKGPRVTAKRTKQTEDSAFTTGRFRLSQYSATPNEGTPFHHGQGPYSSVYRAPLPSVDVTPPGPAPEPSPSPAVPSDSTPTSGSRKIMADPPLRSTRRGSKPQLVQPAATPALNDLTESSPTRSRARSGYTTHVSPSSQPPPPDAIPSPGNSNPRVHIPSPIPTAVTPSTPIPTHISSNNPHSSGYYRRNYENDIQSHRHDSSRLPPGSVQMNDPRNVDATMAPPPSELAASQSKGKEREVSVQRQHGYSEPARPPKGNIRLVTALIEDNRTNPPDHLLAEVYIRCWSGSRPDELWCDAKDLSEALQASASRIDGPAKVFTQRGAYRQCFLRVNTEQEDKYNSMNLALASDRTIPVSVEYWAPPGTQSRPGSAVDWRMPWHSSPTLPQAHPPPSQQAQYPPYPQSQSHSQSLPPQQHHPQLQRLPQPQRVVHQSHAQPHHGYYTQQPHGDGRHPPEVSRKRQAYNEQGSPDYTPDTLLRRVPYAAQHAVHDPRYEAPPVSRNSSTAYPRKRLVPDVSSPADDNMQDEGPMDTRPDHKNSGYNSPQSSEDVRQVVSEMIDELMKVDVTVNNYHRLLRTHKLSDAIHAYRMVEEVCKKYVGRLLPMTGSPAISHRITEADITKGLGAEDPHGFLSECRETLWLLEMYGERGKRDTNPQVLEMFKDTHRSDFNTKPAKQLLKLLREIDAQWMREHSEGGGGDNQRSTPRMT